MDKGVRLHSISLLEAQLKVFKSSTLFLLVRNNEIIDISDQLLKLLGYADFSELPKVFPSLLPKSKPREFLVYHKIFLRESYRQNYELGLVGKNGQQMTLRFVAKLINSDDEESLAMLVGEDVTYQRRRLDELTVPTGLFTFNPYSIVITDGKGTIQTVNPKFEKRTLFKEEDVEGHNIFEYKSLRGESRSSILELILLQKEFRGEFHSKRADGSEFEEDLYVIPLYDYGELQRILFIGDDITNQKNRLLSLEQKANYDDLTGLLRRDVGTSLLYEIGEGEKSYGVFFIDYRDFKLLNDNHDHLVGDEILKEGSHRLSLALRQNDLLIRWGGDEFVAATPNLKLFEDMESIANKMVQAFEQPFNIGDLSLKVHINIGGCFVPADKKNVGVREVIKEADTNMYLTKDDGRAFCISVL